MTSHVSRDACKLFLFIGSSVEAKVYRQLVADKINDGDITTALKICCIGHQIGQGNSLPKLDAQTTKYTVEPIAEAQLCKQEVTKFLSVCNEWYNVLELRGMGRLDPELEDWISGRQYANINDDVVSMVITKCLNAKLEELKKYRAEGMKGDREEDTKKRSGSPEA